MKIHFFTIENGINECGFLELYNEEKTHSIYLASENIEEIENLKLKETQLNFHLTLDVYSNEGVRSNERIYIPISLIPSILEYKGKLQDLASWG